MSPRQLEEFVNGLSYSEIFCSVTVSFSFIYFSLAAAGLIYGRVLRRFGLGEVLETRPTFSGQLFWEIRHSFVSILIFAAYGVLTVWADRAGWVTILWETPSIGRFLLDMTVIVVWNELHFYFIHRNLHRPALFKRIHWVHHKSLVTTPFSTYSFHWIEATALSSVMILAMLFWDFHFIILMLYPLVSLTMNTIGHLNYTIFSDKQMNHVASASRRHAAHHRYFNGNYGFLFPYFDRWWSSALSEKAKK